MKQPKNIELKNALLLAAVVGVFIYLAWHRYWDYHGRCVASGKGSDWCHDLLR